MRIEQFHIELMPAHGFPDGPLMFEIRYRVDGEWRRSTTPVYGTGPEHFESELEWLSRSALAGLRNMEQERLAQ